MIFFRNVVFCWIRESWQMVWRMNVVPLGLRVSSLLMSRLCHDLAGPVGALRNGVELLQECGAEAGADLVEQLADSAQTAARRLQFLRLAYGAAGQGAGEERKGKEAPGYQNHRTAALDWSTTQRAKLEWPANQPAAATAGRPGVARVVMNIVALADDLLPRGGIVTISGQGTAETGSIDIRASGTTIKPIREMAEALDGKLDEEKVLITNVREFFLRRLVQASGCRIHLGMQETEMQEIFSPTSNQRAISGKSSVAVFRLEWDQPYSDSV
jgi:histidine phosphotransferase ChpT